MDRYDAIALATRQLSLLYGVSIKNNIEMMTWLDMQVLRFRSSILFGLWCACRRGHAWVGARDGWSVVGIRV